MSSTRWAGGVALAILLGCAGGALASCNLVVGAGDYVVSADAGARADAGSSGSSSGSSSGASSGSSGSSSGGTADAAPDSKADASPDGGTCVATGKACTADSQCCNFQSQSGFCVDFGSGGLCADSCAVDSDCNSGCCASSSLGLVCSAMSFCAGRGIGDGCTSNAECISGDCTGTLSSSGWCTAPCSPTSAVCAGSGTGTSNQYGNPNLCILNSGNTYKCFPGCAVLADCAPYGGTTCKAGTDATGASVSVCSI